MNTLIPHHLARRWTGFGTSIFTEMSALAREHKAINLAQGFPDFPGPQRLLDAVGSCLKNGSNQYALADGDVGLRQRLSEFVKQTTGLSYDPQSEITVTTGATEAIYAVVNAFVNPGDRVVVFEPFYDSYAQAIANAGGVMVPIRLHAPDTPLGQRAGGQWAIDWDAFDATSRLGFRLMILNSPHNPTGRVFSDVELARLAESLEKNDALAMCDSVYERLVYTEDSLPELADMPGARERVLRVSSAAKTFGFTGFKVGWVMAPAHLTRGVRLVHQGIVFCTNPHVQQGLAEVLGDASFLKTYLLELREDYRAKRDFLKKTLEQAGYVVAPAPGSYFLMAQYEKVYGDIPDIAFARKLILEKGIAAIPPSAFYQNAPASLPWARFAFCKTQATLEQAANRLLS